MPELDRRRPLAASGESLFVLSGSCGLALPEDGRLPAAAALQSGGGSDEILEGPVLVMPMAGTLSDNRMEVVLVECRASMTRSSAGK